MTTSMAMSRRYLLAAGAGSLAVACGGALPAPSSGAAPSASHQEEMARKWYAAWQTKDWGSVDTLAADDFTFSSAAGDDHISKSAYKTQCWDTQSALIDRFELESVLGSGNEVFVEVRLPDQERQSVPERGALHVQGRQDCRDRASFRQSSGLSVGGEQGERVRPRTAPTISRLSRTP